MNNINQKLQNIFKYLSLSSLALGVFNTSMNIGTLKTLRDNLEQEKDKNSKLITEINNDKIEILNNKINEIITDKSFEYKIENIEESVKEVNSQLFKIKDIIKNLLNNNFIDNNIFDIIQSFYNNLNFFQCFALTHLSGFIFIALSLISLVSLYFGDYFIRKFHIEEKYPRIYKFIQLRRKFQIFYLILDLTIIFITLIILSILNIILFVNFTL